MDALRMVAAQRPMYAYAMKPGRDMIVRYVRLNDTLHDNVCNVGKCPVGKSWGTVSSTDVAHALVECSGKGHCVQGECKCQQGFQGNACQLGTWFKVVGSICNIA